MASQCNMRHIRWLLIFVTVFEFRSGLCDISLKMKAKLTGVRKQSVVIPCTYTPSKELEEIRIDWFYESDQSVIHRIESQDTISLVKYRGRVELSKSPPGDVSLTIKKVEPGDQGHFKCKVAWKESSGKLITKEDMTMLKVIRGKTDTSGTSDEESATVEEPTFSTNGRVTQQPLFTTGKPKTIITTVTENPRAETTETEHLITNAPNMEIATTGRRALVTSIIENIVTEKPDATFGSTPGWAITTRNSHEDISVIVSTGKIKHFKESTTATQMFTTELTYRDPEVAASKGSGIFLYVIIISLFCVVCILFLCVVLVARRNKKKVYNYNLPSMNQLALNVEGDSNIAGGFLSSVDPASRVSNVYELVISSSEYQSLPSCSNEYEQLLKEKPEEKNDIC